MWNIDTDAVYWFYNFEIQKMHTTIYILVYIYTTFLLFFWGLFFFAFWKKVVTYRQAAYHFSYCMFIHCFTDFITLPMSHSTKSLKKWKEWYIVYHWCLNVFVDLSFYMYKNESVSVMKGKKSLCVAFKSIINLEERDA